VRNRRASLIVGVVLALVAVVAGVFLLGDRKSNSKPTSTGPRQVNLTCIGGSEKQELMADPRVQAILLRKYHLRVDFQPMGSYEQVQLPLDQLRARKADCLWPSSGSAQLVFEKQHTTADIRGYRAETVLQSPEVIYAGPEGTRLLVKQRIVVQQSNRYSIVDMKRLLLELVLRQKTWEELGAQGIAGPVVISSTDPRRSNSGFTLYQLMLTIVSTDNAYRTPTLAQARAHLDTVNDLYEAQGLQARSSDEGFNQWLSQGAEQHAPLYAGYENQIIQKIVQRRGNSEADRQLQSVVNRQLQENVRILYPEPTIYADHPILALNVQAGRLIDAMKDPKIQTIAWKKFGFRSGVQIGLNNVADFRSLPLADKLRTTAPPNAEVTLALLGCVEQKQCGQTSNQRGATTP
jgi:hypothetical protein